MQVIYPRCAAGDVHKKTVVVCVLITLEDGTVKKYVRTFTAMTADLLALDEWLTSLGVECLALESTGGVLAPGLQPVGGGPLNHLGEPAAHEGGAWTQGAT